MSNHSVGIDFGTSTTLIALREENGEPRVVPLGRTTPWIPSVVGITPSGELVAGEDALALDPRRQIRSIKAKITNSDAYVDVAGLRLDARDVFRALLTEAMQRAEAARPGIFRTKKIYLGCPALWTGVQRRLLTDVLYELGLDVDVADVIDEPVAAGLHSVHSRLLRGELSLSGKTVVFDAGGGTLDVAFLDVTRGEKVDFTVLSAEGIPLSGDAVDEAVVNHLRASIAGLDDLELAELLLRERARDLKEGLSRDRTRDIPLGGTYDRMLSLTRPELEELFKPQLRQSMSLTKSAVRGAELRMATVAAVDEIRRREWHSFAEPIEHVVLTGGLSRMPIIAGELYEIFPGAKITLVDEPQESVALGLAMGDQLDRMNLPRPPVNFTVDFRSRGVATDSGFDEWAAENRIVYHAFTPLYRWDELIRGQSHLAYRFVVPFPRDTHGEIDCVIRAESAGRRRQPLILSVRNVGEKGLVEHIEAGGIRVTHSATHPVRFILYTNGDLLITSRTEEIRLRVTRWPTLRGPSDKQSNKIEIDEAWTERGPSRLQYDDWRFQ